MTMLLPEMPDPAPADHPLQPAERAKLDLLEGIIERGRQTFLEVGNALKTINEERLYRETHPTFEAYLDARWDGMSRRRAYEFIAAAATAAALAETSEVQPRSEGQIRPLTRLEPGQQPEAWKRAVAIAGGDQPTGAEVATAVREIRGEPEPAPKPRRDPSLVEGGYAEFRASASEEPAPAEQCPTCGQGGEPGVAHKCEGPKKQSETTRCSRCGGEAPWEFPAGFNTTICNPCVGELQTPVEPLEDEEQLIRGTKIRCDATDLKYRILAFLPDQGGWQVEVLDPGRERDRTIGERRFLGRGRLSGGGWSILPTDWVLAEVAELEETEAGAASAPVNAAFDPGSEIARLEDEIARFREAARLAGGSANYAAELAKRQPQIDQLQRKIDRLRTGIHGGGVEAEEEAAEDGDQEPEEELAPAQPTHCQECRKSLAGELCSFIDGRKLCSECSRKARTPEPPQIEIVVDKPAPAKPKQNKPLKSMDEIAREKAARQGGEAPKPSPWEGKTSVYISTAELARLARVGGDAATIFAAGCDLLEVVGEFELPPSEGLRLLKQLLNVCCDKRLDPDLALASVALCAGAEAAEDDSDPEGDTDAA